MWKGQTGRQQHCCLHTFVGKVIVAYVITANSVGYSFTFSISFVCPSVYCSVFLSVVLSIHPSMAGNYSSTSWLTETRLGTPSLINPEMVHSSELSMRSFKQMLAFISVRRGCLLSFHSLMWMAGSLRSQWFSWTVFYSLIKYKWSRLPSVQTTLDGFLKEEKALCVRFMRVWIQWTKEGPCMRQLTYARLRWLTNNPTQGLKHTQVCHIKSSLVHRLPINTKFPYQLCFPRHVRVEVKRRHSG